ncbi:HYC_CC_PP family protein [Flavobacterium paronense]|uniref:HYC_CC_PP family protein n=1 Tax=Flavobacterium paronense TaxID=1392775 RepID=UPI003F6A91CC
MILKKQISIFLTFFLLISNLGLAFNVHYCDDKIESVSLSTVSTSSDTIDSCCGVVEKNSNCCKNKIIKSEAKSDQIIVKSVSFDADFIQVYNDWKPLFFSDNFNFKTRDNLTYYCDAHAPPLYLLYSQYTFYS